MNMKRRMKIGLQTLASVVALSVGTAAAPAAENAATGNLPPVVKDGKIAYVLTHRQWAVQMTEDGKQECANGLNVGSRENFAKLFPKDGPPATVVESQLMREAMQFLPEPGDSDPFPFIEATGKVAYGLNLDGKIKDTDFTSPDGEKGIDHQMFRAAACIANFRGPSVQSIWWYENEYVRRYIANRFMIELSGVDSLENDDDVTIRSYRGTNDLLIEAIGDESGQVIAPGGTQGVDERWGKFVQSTWKGKIVDGTLISEPADVQFPIMGRRNISNIVPMKGMRFKLKLTPQRAEGVMAGYADLEKFKLYISTAWPQTYQTYGSMPSISFFQTLDKLADGYPDAKTGKMTAISATFAVKMSQVFIVHPNRPVASNVGGAAAAAQLSER